MGGTRFVDKTPLNTPANTTILSSVRINGETAYKTYSGGITGINPCFSYRTWVYSCYSSEEKRQNDKELFKRRNEVERYFLQLKRFRKVCTRYDKLDSSFLAVIMLAMIFDAVFM